jgi:hypothetical protein
MDQKSPRNKKTIDYHVGFKKNHAFFLSPAETLKPFVWGK